MAHFTLRRLFVITLWVAVICWVVGVHKTTVPEWSYMVPVYKDLGDFSMFDRDYILSLRCMFGIIFFGLFVMFSWQWSKK